MKIRWKVLVICLVSVYFFALVGTILMQNQSSSTWYNQIRPTITPPNFVFPIVWTILFFLIGISLYLAFINSKKKNKKKIIFLAKIWMNIIN